MEASDGDGALRLLMRRHAELLATELENKYPAFTRELKQAVHETHWRQETQCARALIALQRRDAEIDALHRELERKATTDTVTSTRAVAVQCEELCWSKDAALIADQREQIEVLLDELESLRAALDAQQRIAPQVTDEGMQTVASIESAMVDVRGVAGDPSVTPEPKIPKATFTDAPAQDKCPWATAVASLQHACAYMQLSSACSANLSVIDSLEGTECGDLDHRLQTQAMELSHMRQCFDQFREHAAALMTTVHDPQAFDSRRFANEDTGGSFSSMDCASVLNRVLTQLMQQNFSSARSRLVTDDQWRLLLDEVSSRSHNCDDERSVHAAAMIQKWAGWEAAHAHEIQAIRRSCANQLAQSQHRINSLVGTAHHHCQREIDLQAEVNVLKRMLDKRSEIEVCINSKTTASASTETREPSYTELLLQSTHLQQRLYEQTERLQVAERAVRALSLANPHQDTATSTGSDARMGWLTCELQRAKQDLCEANQRCDDLMPLSAQNGVLQSEILSLKQQLAAEQLDRRTITAERDVCKQQLIELDRNLKRIEMRLLTHDAPSPSCTLGNGSEPFDLSGEHGIKLYQMQFLEKERQQLLDRLVRVQTHALVLEQELRGIEHSSVVSGLNQMLENASNVFQRVSDYYDRVMTRVDSRGKISSDENQGSPGSIVRRTIGNLSEAEHLIDTPELRELELKNHLSAVLRASDGIWFSFQHLRSFVCDLFSGTSTPVRNQTQLSMDQLVGELAQRLRGSRHETSWLSHSIELQKHQEKQYLLQRQLSDKELQLHAQSQCLLRAGVSLDDIPSYSTTADVAIQTSSKKQRSRTVQTVSPKASLLKRTKGQSRTGVTNEISTQCEEEPLQQPKQLACNAPHGITSPSRPVNNVPIETDMMQELRNTQQELERSVARISALTHQNDELAQRLRRANKASQKYSKDCKELLSQLTTSANTNALLSDELSRRRQASGPLESSRNEGTPDGETSEQVSALMNHLASREQENLSLVQSLMEIQAKYSKSEESRIELEATVRELQSQQSKAAHDKDAAHVSTLESYMKRVEASLADLELEKNRVESENQTLKAKLEHSARPHVPTTSKSTETEHEGAWESDRCVQEREKLQDQIESLIAQVKYEQRRFEEMDSETKAKRDQDAKQNQITLSALEQERLKQEKWMSELRRHHQQLQQEFAEYRSACTEVQEESETRIAFLTTCVQECSRLVDSPTNQELTTKDLHDAIVSISRNVVTLKARPAAKKPRGSKPATGSAKLAGSEKTRASDMTGSTELGTNDDTVLALDAWKIRASKLEQQLLASTLKMQTFEDMTQRVEFQMEDLKMELKDRMAKEASLLTKNAALKSEIAAMKTQQGSISVQYVHAFESLKRHEAQLAQRDEELARLRLAMQRKSELLTRQKEKTEILQKELESMRGKLAGLAGVEQRFVGFQQKTKEQSQQFHELKSQCAAYQEQQGQLTAQLEREQAQYGSLQARYKAARSENAHLRSHIADLKAKWKADSTPQQSETHQTLQTKLGPTDEIKALKKRMLQKQGVIGSYKVKLADLEQQVETQRSKIVELAHANRLLSQEQRSVAARAEREVSEVQNDLEAQLALRSARLDGLRASVYDSFEAFVHCSHNSSLMSPTSSSSSSSFTASMVSDGHEADHDITDLQRWTELSTHDLLDLDVHQTRHRTRKPLAAPAQRKIQGRRALRSLETALEEAPEDCRPEICHLLEVLCTWKATARSH